MQADGIDKRKRGKKKKKPMGTPQHEAARGYQERLQADSDATKRNVPVDERRRLASQGHALPDGSYPVANADDLANAATLARSGHGDVKAARALIARRAHELNVPNPLATDKAVAHPLGAYVESAPGLWQPADVVPGSGVRKPPVVSPFDLLAGKGAAGNPARNVHSPTGSYAADRVSEPLTDGHQAPSTGDHGVGSGQGYHPAPYGHPTGASPVPGAPPAIQHLDLQTTGASPLATLRSNLCYGANQFSHPSDANVSGQDQASAAGRPRGVRAHPSGNPGATASAPDGGRSGGAEVPPSSVQSGPQPPARGTASPEGHGRHGVTSTPRPSMKSHYDIMRDAITEQLG